MNKNIVKLFQTTPVGDSISVMGAKFVVKKTAPDHKCKWCAFKELGLHCPFFHVPDKFKLYQEEYGESAEVRKIIQAAIKPVCFANQRPDRESVYYVVEDMIWGNTGKKDKLHE